MSTSRHSTQDYQRIWGATARIGREARVETYRSVTRGWWWRGFLSGTVAGFVLGSVLVYVVAWLTGNL